MQLLFFFPPSFMINKRVFGLDLLCYLTYYLKAKKGLNIFVKQVL